MEAAATAAQATESLVQDYGKLVFHIIYGLTGNWQESEDLTQDTFLQAFRGIDAARTASGERFQAKAWLVRIAVNMARMQHRRQRGLRFFTLTELQPEQSTTESREKAPTAAYEELQEAGDLETTIAERDTVQRCMDSLPEGLRLPLLLSIVAGCSSSEIAQMLAINEAAVRQRVTRARKAFQRRYAQESGEHLRTEMTTRAPRQTFRSRDYVGHRSAALALAVR